MARSRIAHYITTGLLSALMLMSAGMYFFNTPEVAKAFTNLNYPTYLIYPLAIAKVLGVATVWIRPTKTLVGLAYAGFFYDFVLAAAAHIMVGDGQFGGAAVALVLLAGSFFTQPEG